MFLNGIAKTNRQTKPHSRRSVFPSQLILQDQGSAVCQQISIPMCGLSWCHMTFPVFPTCKLHRMLGVEQECCHGKKKKKTFAASHHLEWICILFGVQKSDVGQAMFWRVNMLLMPNDSVFWLDVCSCCSVKKDWCAVSTIYKMNKKDLHLWDASFTFPLGAFLSPLWISAQC